MKTDKENPNLCRKSVKTRVKEKIVFQLTPGGYVTRRRELAGGSNTRDPFGAGSRVCLKTWKRPRIGQEGEGFRQAPHPETLDCSSVCVF